MIKTYSQALVTLAACFTATITLAEVEVTVKPFKEVAIAKVLQYPASVVNLKSTEISAETNGAVKSIEVEVGSRVNTGDLLAQLDCREAVIDQQRAQAGLDRLRATRQLTQQQLARARSLLANRSISQEEVDQRETQLRADSASIEEQRALLEAARLRVRRCVIEAPYAGTIVERSVHLGNYVAPGISLFRLVQDDAVEVELEMPAQALQQILGAEEIDFVVDEQRFALTTRTTLPVIDPQSLQQKLRLSITSERKPPGGSFGMVSFATARKFLPARYIQQRDDEFGLFQAKDGHAVFIALENVQEGQAAAADIDAEDLVIIDQLQNLTNGQAVTILR